MLSDKEKEAIELLEDYLICGNKEGVLFRNLRIISTIIEKQQKEIERLEARKYMLNAETGEISQIPIDNNYISKDKIKERIKEYYEYDKRMQNKPDWHTTKYYEAKALEKLLEE